jgi:hypothetical protein
MNECVRWGGTLTAIATLVLGCGGDGIPPGGAPADSGNVSEDTELVSADSDPGSADTTPLPPPTDGGGCTPVSSGTQAVHINMLVTWPGTIGTESGSGTVHVWTLSKFKIDGSNTITATNSPCGSLIPDIQTTPIAGGGKVQAEFPSAIWKASAMPSFTTTGVQSGYEIGSTVTMKASPVLVGLTMPDPTAPWPSLASITGVDSDGDGKPGITSVPKTASGYAQPPTSLLRFKSADKLYVASRTTSGTNGTRVACDLQKGPATVTSFDNHIIGCHVAGGAECTTADYQFIDANRTVYAVTSAAFEAKLVADTATCDDVRATLPAK